MRQALNLTHGTGKGHISIHPDVCRDTRDAYLKSDAYLKACKSAGWLPEELCKHKAGLLSGFESVIKDWQVSAGNVIISVRGT